MELNLKQGFYIGVGVAMGYTAANVVLTVVAVLAKFIQMKYM